MKKSYFKLNGLSFILGLILLNVNVYPQSNAADFYPLKVGNRWVYNFWWMYSGNIRYDIKVIDTLITNGHKYYKIHGRVPPGSNYFDSFIRVDSLTGSLRQYTTNGGCAWLTNEMTGDSLSAMLNDSFMIQCNSFFYRMQKDTTYNVLGLMKRVMQFEGTNYFEQSGSRYYAKDIGPIILNLYGPPYTSTTRTLIGCLINGTVYGDTTITAIKSISISVPNYFSLIQNYPNPFNPTTKIRFDIPPSKGVRGMITLIIYDILGREIAILVNESATGGLQPGTYEVEWDGTNYSSGVYFYQLSINNEQLVTKKMILIK